MGSMRSMATAVVVLGCFALASAPARAEGEGPVLVIPSRPAVPVIRHGRAAAYAVAGAARGLPRQGAGVLAGGRRPAHVGELSHHGVDSARTRGVDPEPRLHQDSLWAVAQRR